jgi:hypothetical protein
MAAVARPPPQPDDDAPLGTTCPSRSRVSRTEVDYRRLHRGTLKKEEASRQIIARSGGAQESQLNTILKAVASVRESVDERFALVQEAVAEISDTGQIRETISEELSSVVQDRPKVIVQREIVNAIREEMTRTVQQQVSEVVRREVGSVVQHEVKSIVDENVAAIIQQQVTSIVKEQVTTIIQEQVTAILEKQLFSIQLSSPNASYADIARAPPGSHPSNLRTLSDQTTPSILTDTLYCTIDVSNVEEAERGMANAGNIRQEIEKGMREGEARSGWRCVAVTRDPRNIARIRITCRDESELAHVKEVAEKTKAVSSRVLRDQWYQSRWITHAGQWC